MAVVGCDIPVRQVVGAEQLANAQTGIWTKTHFYQQGPYLHAKTFLVAAGEPSVLEFRIDLRPLEKVAAAIHQRMHRKMADAARESGQPVIGFSFAKAFRSIKKTAKKIGHSKLVKAVGKGIKAVAKSKVVGALATGLAVAVPVVGIPALAAYGAAKTAIGAVKEGKKLIHTATKAKHVLSRGADTAKKIAAAKASIPQLQAAAQARAAAQAKAQASAVARQALAAKASAQRQIAEQARVAAAARARANAATNQAARQAQAKVAAAAQAKAQAAAKAAAQHKAAAAARAKQIIAQAKQRAAAYKAKMAQQVSSAASKAAPVVTAAAQLEAKLSNPAVQQRLLDIKKQADSAKKVLEDIREKARFGTGAEKLDAQKSAAIVNLVARNEARIQQMSQQNAGGLPAMLIDSHGRITRGKFKVIAKTGGKNPDVLYQGPNQQVQSGSFSRVSGGVPGIGADHWHWWTIAIRNPKSNRWISLQSNGILFRDHASASKAAQHHNRRGVEAKAALVKHTPSPEEIAKSRKLLGTRISGEPPLHDDVPGETVGASPFPPLSPREKQAKQAEYEAWLSKHGQRRHPRVGWAASPSWGSTVGWAAPPAWESPPGSIGCDCEGTQF